jgi:hypothetical protein
MRHNPDRATACQRWHVQECPLPASSASALGKFCHGPWLPLSSGIERVVYPVPAFKLLLVVGPRLVAPGPDYPSLAVVSAGHAVMYCDAVIGSVDSDDAPTWLVATLDVPFHYKTGKLTALNR